MSTKFVTGSQIVIGSHIFIVKLAMDHQHDRNPGIPHFALHGRGGGEERNERILMMRNPSINLLLGSKLCLTGITTHVYFNANRQRDLGTDRNMDRETLL